MCFQPRQLKGGILGKRHVFRKFQRLNLFISKRLNSIHKSARLCFKGIKTKGGGEGEILGNYGIEDLKVIENVNLKLIINIRIPR